MKKLFILLIPLFVACTTSKNIVHSQTTIERNIDTILTIKPKIPFHIDHAKVSDTLKLSYGNLKQKIYYVPEKKEIITETTEENIIIPVKMHETVKTDEVKKAINKQMPETFKKFYIGFLIVFIGVCMIWISDLLKPFFKK